jgi:hypothetical protein
MNCDHNQLISQETDSTGAAPTVLTASSNTERSQDTSVLGHLSSTKMQGAMKQQIRTAFTSQSSVGRCPVVVKVGGSQRLGVDLFL